MIHYLSIVTAGRNCCYYMIDVTSTSLIFFLLDKILNKYFNKISTWKLLIFQAWLNILIYCQIGIRYEIMCLNIKVLAIIHFFVCYFWHSITFDGKFHQILYLSFHFLSLFYLYILKWLFYKIHAAAFYLLGRISFHIYIKHIFKLPWK